VDDLTNRSETMSNTTAMQGMLYRTLGSTGEKVSAIGIGGWHIGLKGVDEQLSIRIIRTAVDRGINFMDNSWDYNEGASEIRMGKALRDGYRDRVFLMTKGLMPHSWRPGKRGNSDISVSRGTRTQRSICICCKWRRIMVSLSMRFRCRST